MITSIKDMVDTIEQACNSIELLSAWDKPPHSDWYYEAKSFLADRAKFERVGLTTYFDAKRSQAERSF